MDLNDNNVFYLNINAIKDENTKNKIIERNKVSTNICIMYCYDKNGGQIIEIPINN